MSILSVTLHALQVIVGPWRDVPNSLFNFSLHYLIVIHSAY